ncbi:hypothetical protein GN958_ATG13030 [Phytophthora infestans]|uniref:Uncharacterized protein n=1 Tax=Phytophthora infestans TaxID=4787 RepID=A0A8S9UE16_PHYIN|nr:hypothetical protein GN958_ATG13030 [Phytophthora infestans]
MATERGAPRGFFKATNALQGGFLRRHHLSFRAKTRQGHIYPSDASTVAKNCRVEVLAKMAAFYIDMIYNVDQTPVLLGKYSDVYYSEEGPNDSVDSLEWL